MGISVAWPVRVEVYQKLLAGGSLLAVATDVGVARRTVGRWAKLAGMTVIPGRWGGITLPPHQDPIPDQHGSYRRLALADRVFIEYALSGPVSWSIRGIAKHLGRSPSTISREVSGNLIVHGHGRKADRKEHHYVAEVAHFRAMTRRHADGSRKLDDPETRARVVSLLNEGWSPDAIAGRLTREFPQEAAKRVSHETIYQALYVQGRGALRHELAVEQALRSGRTTRKPQSKLPRRSSRPWLDGARLSERPAQAMDRAVPGHWEGDLVVGPHNSGIVTLVERRSRFALVGRLPGNRESATVVDRMQAMVAGLPQALFRTITWDQGSEMARHEEFTVATGCRMFFCDPHSPWQRGSNENLNGLIRDFFPKGTDFNEVTDAELARVQDMFNTRPRKTLGYWTPSEKLRNEIGVALTT